jgi:hypothetical protein
VFYTKIEEGIVALDMSNREPARFKGRAPRNQCSRVGEGEKHRSGKRRKRSHR